MTRQVERFFQFSLLGLVASGFLALAGSGYLDRPTLVLTFLGLLARALAIAGVARLRFTPRQATIAALLYLAFLPADYYWISREFLTATVHGVCFLAVIKVLTADTTRDYGFTGVISFLELIAAALLSDQSGFIAYLILYILFAVAAFTSGQIHYSLQNAAESKFRIEETPRGRLPLRIASIAGGATVAIVLMTIGLFFAVPRTARATARYLPGQRRMTGFSNVVDLGGFGGIAKDNRPVMHVRAYSQSQAQSLPPDARWLGATLSRFDGRRWSEPPAPGAEIPAAPGIATVAERSQLSRRDGHRVMYSVDVASAGNGTLFLTGIPEFLNIDTRAVLGMPSGAFRVLTPPRAPLRYQVSAFLGRRLPEQLAPAQRNRYLQFPPLDTRILALAREWAGDGPPLAQAQRIQSHLQHDFRYVLDGPPAPVTDPLADFLFVRKEGYCEYFASAMAVMLRSRGIPARVATGFLGGFYNDVTHTTVIRASDAHAWVEAYIAPADDEPGVWTTFDPTPVGTGVGPSPLVSRLSMYMEAADDVWREWVISYDLGHQAIALAQFETAWRRAFRPRAWNGISGLTGWLLGALCAIGLGWIFGPRLWGIWKRRSHLKRIVRSGGEPADASILYGQLLDRLARRGFVKPESATPLEFAAQLPVAERRIARPFTELYNSLRFGGDTAATARLAALLAEFDAEKPMYN